MKKCWKGISIGFSCLILASALILERKMEKVPVDVKQYSLPVTTCNVQTGYWEEGCPMHYVLASEESFQEFSEEHFHIAEEEEFLQQIGETDASFFEKYVLFAALVTSGSGSDQYAVSDVEMLEDGKYQMTVSRKRKGIGTADMSEWFLFARIDCEELDFIPEDFELRIEDE